jgi:hypothetical protein
MRRVKREEGGRERFTFLILNLPFVSGSEEGSDSEDGC